MKWGTDGQISSMTKAISKGLRHDLVPLAWHRVCGVVIERIVEGFGMSKGCLLN